ncbi:hypothetical protein [Burkholderia anthina]|uniref:hypothetical protein n=1 Tax=Burkholderia anthina TaxID=179879 RepID=UPI001ABBDBFD|nr:hypothetical protein [Burkholderia anthina]
MHRNREFWIVGICGGRPEVGHFEFGLKYEELHFEFFARLFAVVGPGFDLSAALSESDRAFGSYILMRTASWLTFKESRASFLIEKEVDQADRIQWFAYVIAQYRGRIDAPLSASSLHTLQARHSGPRCVWLGVRRSPVFVGQATMRENIVHYIAPAFEDVTPMLAGPGEFEAATRGAEPLARSLSDRRLRGRTSMSNTNDACWTRRRWHSG